MNFRLVRLIALVTLALAGCAAMTPPPYIAPEAGSVATVKFKNESAKKLRVSVYVQPKDCTERRLVGFAGPNKDLAVTVRGGEALTFEYYLTTTGVTVGAEQYCFENLRFTPAAGGVYVFRTTDVSGSCEWAMTDAGGSKVSLTHLPWKRGFVETSPACREEEAQPDPGVSKILVERHRIRI